MDLSMRISDRKMFYYYYTLQRAVDTIQKIEITFKEVVVQLKSKSIRTWGEIAQTKV